MTVPVADPWAALRAATPARIGLGRSGDAQPLAAVLAFQLAHARARDAVVAALDTDAIAAALPDRTTLHVRSRASGRDVYLRRPDLGRRLDPACVGMLAPGGWDAVFVIADGLSAGAVQRHAVPVLRATLARLAGWRIGPVVIATQARVALGDEIGAALGAGMVVMLIGERPGLSVADSLGIYLTAHPRVGRRDAERNCLSNIHPAGGFGYDEAAGQLARLMHAARRRGLSGVASGDAMTLTDARA